MGKTEETAWVKAELSKVFDVKDLEAVKHFLSINTFRDRVKRTVTMSQVDKIDAVLENSYGYSGSKPKYVFMVEGFANTKGVPLNAQEHTEYGEIVGSLIHIGGNTRTEIMQAVSSLAKFSSCPDSVYMAGAQHLLKCLNATRLKALAQGGGSGGLIGFIDSDSAGDKSDRKFEDWICVHLQWWSYSVDKCQPASVGVADPSCT
eukprot:264906-Chlamydomonas_euryale.AAC.1